ncbi:NAD-dependent epimerase/dehydratase family protein [Pendulispora albinea]|uniref:NAD(P)-dependent oxidoreductase n=1 Tax=Pendulispora albinea TaxID=2741071 RepID=A0ABZ2LRJ6_9BACT
MTHKKILITGGSGQVAGPAVEALVGEHEVWCLGRFSDPEAERSLTTLGARTVKWDMGKDSLEGVPDDFTHVIHSAVHRGDGKDFQATVEINGGGAARLMTHCRKAKAFLYISTGAVYARNPDQEHFYAETDPLGGHAPWLPTYPLGKISGEAVVRALAITLGVPTTIARLNVAYGPRGHGGMPILLFRRMLAGEPVAVPRQGQNRCNLLHTDDVVRQIPLLWDVASVPTRVVNWGHDEAVGVSDMLRYMSEITRIEAKLEPSDFSRETIAFDNAVRERLIGRCEVDWREGLRRTLEDFFPGIVKTALVANSYQSTAAK